MLNHIEAAKKKTPANPAAPHLSMRREWKWGRDSKQSSSSWERVASLSKRERERERERERGCVCLCVCVCVLSRTITRRCEVEGLGAAWARRMRWHHDGPGGGRAPRPVFMQLLSLTPPEWNPGHHAGWGGDVTFRASRICTDCL